MVEPIAFETYDHSFCEATLYSTRPHPEYFNSISSLFITFIGIQGFYRPFTGFFLKLLFAALAVNGLTSFFYHWTNEIGWGLMDRMSMILIAMSSTYLIFPHFHLIIRLERWKEVRKMVLAIHILVCSYFTLLFTIAGLHWEKVFNCLFGLFLISLVIFMFFVDKYREILELPYEVLGYGWRGVKYIAWSGFFWIVTESLCNEVEWMKYMMGHVFWHIFVSYGGYLLSLVPNYLSLKQKKDWIVLKKDCVSIPYLFCYNSSYSTSMNV